MASTKVLIGRRIRELRVARGLSQGALAERAGIEQREVSAYERGLSFPRPERLDDIASGLGLTPEMLFTLGAEPRQEPGLSRAALQVAQQLEHALQTRPDYARTVIKVVKVLLRG